MKSKYRERTSINNGLTQGTLLLWLYGSLFLFSKSVFEDGNVYYD